MRLGPLNRLRGGRTDGDDRILVVGLGNPGSRYERSRHNAGFMALSELARRWDAPRARDRFRGRIAEGRAGPGGPRVALLQPLTFMNEAGTSVGPARGSLKVPLDRLVVLHDEIDLPFGEIQARMGGGLAGHNGLRSVAAGVGGPEFWRVRIGVGRPDTTDPEIVSAYVLGRFTEPEQEVRGLIAAAADEAESLVASLDREPAT
jgi:peptidyl-tRNA hydrolase, PTH1 family